jgi:hypothetical protein
MLRPSGVLKAEGTIMRMSSLTYDFISLFYKREQMQKQDIICLEIKDRLLFIDMDYSTSVKNRTNQDPGY